MNAVRAALVSGCVLALALATGACAKHKSADLSGPDTTAPPPMVTDFYPPDRAIGVLADTGIWVEFDRDLDQATLTTDRIFLKRDTRRIPIAIVWEPAQRRVRLVPQTPLELLRTHTVSFGDGVRGTDGTAIMPFFWQFKTEGVRPPGHPYPASGTVDESAFVPLAWDSTEHSVGTIRYEVFIGPDSGGIAARSVQPTGVTSLAAYVPDPPWALGETYYWAVRTTNLSTQDVAEGPVWRFETLPVGLPVDSLMLTATQWGSVRHVPNFRDNVSCFSSTFACGPSYNGAIDWDVSVLGTDVRLADASLILTPANLSSPAGHRLTISGTDGVWSACSIGYPGPPYDDPAAAPLAVGEATLNGRVWFHSPAFTSHLESRMRGATRSGYRLGAEANFSYGSPTNTSETRRPMLVVRYYVRDTQPVRRLP